MSVALLFKHSAHPGALQYIPVASEDTFLHYWYPAAVMAGLYYIPLMNPGYDLTIGDLEPFLAELELLKGVFTDSLELGQEWKTFLTGRITALQERLWLERGNPDLSIFAG